MHMHTQYKVAYSPSVKSSLMCFDSRTETWVWKGVKLKVRLRLELKIFQVFYTSENCSENVLITKYKRIFNF